MADTTITCPHCHQEIRLTDALAAPFIEKARADVHRGLLQPFERRFLDLGLG